MVKPFEGQAWSSFLLKTPLADDSDELVAFQEAALLKLTSLQNGEAADSDLVDYMVMLLNDDKTLSDVAGEIDELMVDESANANHAVTLQLCQWVSEYFSGEGTTESKADVAPPPSTKVAETLPPPAATLAVDESVDPPVAVSKETIEKKVVVFGSSSRRPKKRPAPSGTAEASNGSRGGNPFSNGPTKPGKRQKGDRSGAKNPFGGDGKGNGFARQSGDGRNSNPFLSGAGPNRTNQSTKRGGGKKDKGNNNPFQNNSVPNPFLQSNGRRDDGGMHPFNGKKKKKQTQKQSMGRMGKADFNKGQNMFQEAAEALRKKQQEEEEQHGGEGSYGGDEAYRYGGGGGGRGRGGRWNNHYSSRGRGYGYQSWGRGRGYGSGRGRGRGRGGPAPKPKNMTWRPGM
jgi:hypothetical protein